MPPNNALHLVRGLGFVRPPAGECERSAHMILAEVAVIERRRRASA